MSLKRFETSLMVLITMFICSGCSLVVGLIAANQDEPISLVVTIESDPPGAEIYLNQTKLGTAPLKITIEGLAKEHKIVFIKNGYQTRIERVSISSGPQLDEKYLSVTRPDGTKIPVEDNTLNVVLKKETIAP